jgi:glycosyltransferase involved in cell wall biosynthesis
MKKVVIIGPAYPLRGGLATFNQRLAEELERHHFPTIIYTFKLQYPPFLFPGKTQLDTDQNTNGLDIRSCIHSMNPLNWIKVAKEIAELQPDLVICRYWIPFFGPCLGSILRLIKRHSRARIVALVDNLIPHERRLGDNISTRYFLTPVDDFLVMSHKVKKDIEALGLNKPVIKLSHPIYDNYGPGVSKPDALKFLGLPADASYILFFGFIRRYKGLDLLVKAMADPLLKNSKVRLIVAGEFYEKEEIYRKLIERQAITDQVLIFPDYVSNHDVKYYFSACDLVVLPYRSASQSGISQIAFHYGKPVLATGVGGLPEMVRDGVNGFITDPGSTEIAQSIRRFLDSPHRDTICENILRDQHKFSWSGFTLDFLLQLGMHRIPKKGNFLTNGSARVFACSE